MIQCPAGPSQKKTLIVPKGCEQVIYQTKLNIFDPEVQKNLAWKEAMSAGAANNGSEIKGGLVAQGVGAATPRDATPATPATPITGESIDRSAQRAAQATLAEVRHVYCLVLS